MATKAKPLLHLVAGSGDPEMFNTDLHWYFTCYDFECGLKSSQGADIGGRQMNLAGYQKNKVGSGGDSNDDPDDRPAERLEVKAKKPIYARQENLPYTDRHATFASNHKVDHTACSFTRGRRVWQKLSRIAWSQQELLRALYEPRQVPLSLPEHRIRAAHRAYREAAVAA